MVTIYHVWLSIVVDIGSDGQQYFHFERISLNSSIIAARILFAYVRLMDLNVKSIPLWYLFLIIYVIRGISYVAWLRKNRYTNDC